MRAVWRKSVRRLGLKLAVSVIALAAASPGPVFDPTGLSLTPHFWIDATNGDDANDGSEGSPWATLSKIDKSLVASGQVTTFRVKAGTYDTADEFINISGVNLEFGTEINIVVEPGTIINGSLTGGNFLEQSGTGNFSVINFFGNDAQISGYSIPSANTFGNRNSTILNVYSADIVDGEDGFSAHGSSTINAFFCRVRAGVSRPWVHVDTSVANAYDCILEGSTLYLSLSSGKLVRCQLNGADGSAINGDVDVEQSQIGTLTTHYEVTGNGPQFKKSFVNVYHDASNAGQTSLSYCFGFFTSRLRLNGLAIDHCIFAGPAAGQSTSFFSNFDPGDVNKYDVRDTIFTGAYTFQNIAENVAAYMGANGSEFLSNLLSDGKVYDTDLAAQGVTISGTVSADPLIGAANTLDPDDYGYGTGSPAIGAATDGGNIGFAIGELPAVGPRS